jgi:RNA polymerase sigma factor (TIGR02999 family)
LVGETPPRPDGQTRHRGASCERPFFKTRVNDIRKILEASSQSGGRVSSELLPLVYDELRALAAKRLAKESGGQTLQPTALVHEAWLSISGNEDASWNDRTHFFRTAAQAMRWILVQRARAKSTLKRGEGKEALDIDSFDLADTPIDERVLLVDEMMDRLEQEDPESARVISLKFFGGLTNKEIAAMEGVTERTIERHWAYAKARLLQMYLEEE